MIRTYQDTVEWLRDFGYIGEFEPDADMHTLAVSVMQDAYGLTSDGNAGEKTRRAMAMPRCGCMDVVTQKPTRWMKKQLTYYVDGGLDSLGDITRIMKDIEYGFVAYRKVTELSFVRTLDPAADLLIGCGFGNSLFCRENIIVYVESPAGGRDQLKCVFNDSYPWTVNHTENIGLVFYPVWMHALGHMLGLVHSDRPESVMSPFYNPMNDRLTEGDQDNLEDLYEIGV